MGAGEIAAGDGSATCEETRFLIDAVVATPVPTLRRSAAQADQKDRVVWIIDLFTRLERRVSS